MIGIPIVIYYRVNCIYMAMRRHLRHISLAALVTPSFSVSSLDMSAFDQNDVLPNDCFKIPNHVLDHAET